MNRFERNSALKMSFLALQVLQLMADLCSPPVAGIVFEIHFAKAQRLNILVTTKPHMMQCLFQVAKTEFYLHFPSNSLGAI